MGALEFVSSPEVATLTTHMYAIDAPDDVWVRSPPKFVVSLPPLIVHEYPRGRGIEIYAFGHEREQVEPLFRAVMGMDVQSAMFALAMRELIGHKIPIAIYDPSRAVLLIKLATSDEQQTPCRGIHPAVVRF